jgi:RNA-directed DNA polymerase
MGLELSEEKTSITEISKGFDFLGFNIRKYDEKLLIKPSKDNILGFRQGIRETVKVSQNLTGKSLIMKLNPKITGWGNYYRHVVSKETFSKQDDYLFKRTYKWVEQKHLNNSKKGLVKRYFKTEEDGVWNLKDDSARLTKMSDIPII